MSFWQLLYDDDDDDVLLSSSAEGELFVAWTSDTDRHTQYTGYNIYCNNNNNWKSLQGDMERRQTFGKTRIRTTDDSNMCDIRQQTDTVLCGRQA